MTPEKQGQLFIAVAEVCRKCGYSIDPYFLPWFIQLNDEVVVRRNSNSPTVRPYLHLRSGKKVFANLVFPSAVDAPTTPWELQVLDAFMLVDGRQLVSAIHTAQIADGSKIEIVEYDEMDEERPIHEDFIAILT